MKHIKLFEKLNEEYDNAKISDVINILEKFKKEYGDNLFLIFADNDSL